MTKCRIIKRTNVEGETSYMIQKKRPGLKARWVDAWFKIDCGVKCRDSFSTLEDAKNTYVTLLMQRERGE